MNIVYKIINLHDIRWIKTWSQVFFLLLQLSDYILLSNLLNKSSLPLQLSPQTGVKTASSLYEYKTSSEKQRDSSVCSSDSTWALYCTPSVSSGHVDVCDLCPQCCVNLCQCFPPLHLCDEPLPENVNCDLSDLCFLPLFVLSAC